MFILLLRSGWWPFCKRKMVRCWNDIIFSKCNKNGKTFRLFVGLLSTDYNINCRVPWFIYTHYVALYLIGKKGTRLLDVSSRVYSRTCSLDEDKYNDGTKFVEKNKFLSTRFHCPTPGPSLSHPPPRFRPPPTFIYILYSFHHYSAHFNVWQNVINKVQRQRRVKQS